MFSMLFALFCATALIFVGELDGAADMSAGILLLWGLGIFFLPRPIQRGWRLLAGAAVVRLFLLPVDGGLFSEAPLLLADAEVLWNGGNPYSGDDPSIYSPLKLWIAAPLAGLDTAVWPLRIAAVCSDVLVVWLLDRVLTLRKRIPDAAWIYALHPLGAVEASVHGGMTSLVLACALLAAMVWLLGQSGLGWASLGGLLGGLPFTMLPALWRRSPGILGATAALAAILIWPLADTNLAHAFQDDFSPQPGLPGILYLSVSPVLGPAVGWLSGLCGIAMLTLIWKRWRDPIDLLLWTATAWILLAPTLAPATILWVWIPALICGVRSWSVLATLAPLSYLCLPSSSLMLVDPSDTEWIPWMVFLPFLLSFGIEFVRHQTRPGPWQTGPARTTLESPSPI